MESLSINEFFTNRLLTLKTLPQAGKSVLYVMTRELRIKDNFGLIAAQQHALTNKLPLAVAFSFTTNASGQAREHFDFMLSGLYELENELKTLNIPFIGLFGMHIETINNLAYHTNPAVIFTDSSPLIEVRKWQETLAQTLPIIVVDSHNIVPVWVASNKQEFSARTIRPKIHTHLSNYLLDTGNLVVHPYAWPGKVLTLSELQDNIKTIRASYPTNGTKIIHKSGEKNAFTMLQHFIDTRLDGYAQCRNDPTVDGQSNLSPYLHFGMLSSMSAVRAVKEKGTDNPNLAPDIDVFVEEIVVRKELADNFCFYANNYRSLTAAPRWAVETLRKHQIDHREFVYTKQQFEDAQTHDLAWNAAQSELRQTGKMHGYMRMYWAKKVLEWSRTPQEALDILIYLNDFYSIDGGDPNGYAGILWSIAGLHDRPWGERPIYGTVRSMVYNGLKRKFAITEYEKKWS